MDEAGFKLSSKRRTRRVGPRGASRKSQTSLADSDLITVIGAISTFDTPVPPYLIYPGAHFLVEWARIRDPTPLIAINSNSGYSNSYLVKKWLTDCFDPYTKQRAGTSRRLLILDGFDTHVQVDFLEECWARNIVCLVLPANLSSVFQPLDVDLFNTLKLRYHDQVDEYQLGSAATRAPKDYFYRWFQRAWKNTITKKQIQRAWREAGLWPLSEEIMRGRVVTPEPQTARTKPETPQNVRMGQTIDRQLRQGNITAEMAYKKVLKAFQKVAAEKTLLEADIARRDAAAALDRAARASKKRTRFPQGQLFDQQYQDQHEAELAQRKATELESREKKKADAQASRKGKGRAHGERPKRGRSTAV